MYEIDAREIFHNLVMDGYPVKLSGTNEKKDSWSVTIIGYRQATEPPDEYQIELSENGPATINIRGIRYFVCGDINGKFIKLVRAKKVSQ
jgi:hypothetical protein